MKRLFPLATTLALAAAVSCAGQPKDLVVTSFSPRPTTDDPQAPIRLRFNRPVVEEAQVGKPLATPPVAVSPAAAVEAHWEDRQTLVLKPTAPLRTSTRYQVTLAGDLAARADQTGFTFVNQPLAVTGVMGVDPARVPARPAVTLHFNQPVAVKDVADRCRITDAATGNTASALAVEGEGTADKVKVHGKDALAPGTDFSLVCGGLSGAGGNAGLDEPFTYKLHTYPELHVTAFQPDGRDVAADQARLVIDFANPVDRDKIARALKAEPAVRGLDKGWLDDTRTRYTVEVDLDAGQDYAVTVQKGASDVYGQKLAADAVFSFHTGDATPRMSMEKGIFAVEPIAKGYPLWTRNMSTFRLDCARVPRDKLVALLTSDMNYDPWYDASENKPLDWSKLGIKDLWTDVRTNEKKNKWHLQNLPLAKMCGGGPDRGLFLAEVTSKEMTPPAQNDQYYWRYKPRQRVLANVTDIGLVLKVGGASGVIWATSIETGKAIAGAQVTLFDPKGKQVFTGKTGDDGLLKLPGAAELLKQPGIADKDKFEENAYEDWDWRAQRMIALVEKDTDMAVVDGTWQNGIQVWNFGVSQDRQSGKTRIRGFIQSDRGIYRPGEEVHFKGIVREIEIGKSPHVPSGKTIAVVVEDAKGQKLFDKALDVSSFGGFAMDLTLSTEAPLGDYFVTATIKNQTFREKFMVQEFRKVEYEVKLKGGKAHLGDEVAFETHADYLFGAPVAGAKVKWSVSRRQHRVSFPRFPEFSFVDFGALGDDYWWTYYRQGQYPSFVSDGAGETDKTGKLAFSFKDPETALTGSQDYLAEVSVTDETDQTVSSQVAVTAHASDFYLGMHVNEWVQAVDMPFAVNLLAVDTEGKQMAAKATLSMIRQTPDCTWEGGYRSYATCTKKYEKLWTRDVTIPATGMGIERIYPKSPGEFIIKVESTDAHGAKVVSSDWVYVIGKGEAFWSGDESDRMSLVASKTEYQPGEKAKLVPKTSLNAGTALVTLERNGVLDAWTVPMSTSGQGIEVPLTDAHAPNVYASVAVVQGRTGEGDRHRPRFQMGVVDLNVKADQQRLKVEVSTEKPSYQPGDQVSGSIKISGADGTPVKAEVSLSVADEGVLQLIAYKTPDPMGTFYAPWGLGVDSATTWNRISRMADPQAGDPDEGGDGGDSEGPGIRSRFVSSAFWASALISDDKGEIRFSFRAPDNLTAFRLMAVAADPGARFGSADSRFTLKKPLLLQPVLPRFLSEGDKAEVGVVVHNYTGAAGEARVTAKATGVTLATSEQTVKLDKDGQARVMFPVDVGTPQPGDPQATFTFTTKMSGASDGVKLSIPLGRPLTIDKALAGKGKVERTADVAVKWDDAVLAADSRLEVSVDRTGMSELGPSLQYLVQYPYGCLEQTLSRFIPLVKVKDLASSLALKELEGPKLETFVKLGVNKVYRFQHEDGNFSLWMAGDTHPHLTVYAMYGLNEAKRAGVPVDAAVVKRGTEAIRRWIAAPDRVLASRGDGAILAMAAYVLADMGQPDPALNARLFEARRGLPVFGQAYLLSALSLAKAPDKQVKQLEAEILTRLVVDGDAATVVESDPSHELEWYMNSDARSTAITLSALMRVDPASKVVDQLVAGLKKSQRPQGYWYNTSENLFALVALADYARRASDGTAVVSLSLAGKPLARKTLKGGDVLAYATTLDKVKPGALRLESDTPVRYVVRLVTARREDVRGPQSRGFEVRREYLDPDTKKPIQGIKTGQLVRVHLEVHNREEQTWVAVVDPLPAGFEIVNTKLATAVHGNGDAGGGEEDEERRWWNPPVWSNIELHDDRAQAFSDRLPAGTVTFDYLVRATLPGKFMAAPAHAEAMYQPDVNGRTGSAAVEITRK